MKNYIQDVNFSRIIWCLEESNISLDELHSSIKFKDIEKKIKENKITFNQLKKVANFFNKTPLFFLEKNEITDNKIYSVNFRTIKSQKPDLHFKIKSLIQKIESLKEVYLSLLEELNQNYSFQEIKIEKKDIVKIAQYIRKEWLKIPIEKKIDFEYLRNKIEEKGIWIILTNSYLGDWYLPKNDNIRGFLLYDTKLPIILVKKQEFESAQVFTLLHELGHLLLHRTSCIDDKNNLESVDTNKNKETEANLFAGNLQLPNDLLKKLPLKDIQNIEISQYNEYLKEYSKKYGISYQVLLRRLVDNKYLEKEKYNQYLKSIDNKKIENPIGGTRYRYKEPKKIFGSSYVKTIFECYQQKKITLSKASSYLDNLDIKYFREMEKSEKIYI